MLFQLSVVKPACIAKSSGTIKTKTPFGSFDPAAAVAPFRGSRMLDWISSLYSQVSSQADEYILYFAS